MHVHIWQDNGKPPRTQEYEASIISEGELTPRDFYLPDRDEKETGYIQWGGDIEIDGKKYYIELRQPIRVL